MLSVKLRSKQIRVKSEDRYETSFLINKCRSVTTDWSLACDCIRTENDKLGQNLRPDCLLQANSILSKKIIF